MSLDAIRLVTEAEAADRERIAAAEAQAYRMRADAERDGAELLQKTRDEAEKQEKELLRQAEKRAEAQATEIRRNTEREREKLRKQAQRRMDAAADWIIRKITEG